MTILNRSERKRKDAGAACRRNGRIDRIGVEVETGMSAPELTVLLELADFFEVSVDTLMGHVVNANRKDKMIDRSPAFRNKEKRGCEKT